MTGFRQFGILADSLGQATEGNFETATFGKGSWPEFLAEQIANIPGVGPLISPGLRMCSLGVAAGDLSGEWTKTGSWTKTASTDAFDKAPYGYAYLSGDTSMKYRTDGGSYTNFPTVTRDNGIHRIHIATAVTTSIDIANSAGTKLFTYTIPAPWRRFVAFAIDFIPTSTDTALIGIVPYFVDPLTATTGVIFHDLGVNGEKLSALAATTSGDRLAWVRAGAVTLEGSAISHTPNAGVLLIHINDIPDNSVSSWNTNLGIVDAVVGPLGPFAIISPWECNTGIYNSTFQANHRTQTKLTAGAFATRAYVIDLYDELDRLGITGNAATTAAGLLLDGTHQSQTLHAYMADKVGALVRNQFLSGIVGPNVNAYSVGRSTLGGSVDTFGGLPIVTLAVTAADTAGGSDVATRISTRTRTAADTAGGTDSAGRLVVFGRTCTDAAGGADVASRALVVARTAADTAGGTDVATRAPATLARAAADTAGGTDSASRLDVLARTATDTAGATDVASASAVKARATADTAGGTDSAARTFSVARAAADSAGGTDVASRADALERTAADVAGGTDSATRTSPKARTAADVAGGSDVASRAFVLARTGADTAGGTDSATRTTPKARTTADTAGGTDAASRAFVVARSSSDTAGGTDTAARGTPLARTADDTAGATDVASRTTPRARSAADTAGGSDSASRGLHVARTAADSAGGTDVASGSVASGSAHLNRTAADSAGGTDTCTRIIRWIRTSSDVAGGTESAARGFHGARIAADVAGGTDLTTRTFRTSRTSADTAGGTDSTSPSLRLFRTATDTAGGSDVAHVFVPHGPPIVAFAVRAVRSGWTFRPVRSGWQVGPGGRADLVHVTVTSEEIAWGTGEPVDWQSGDTIEWSSI